MSYCGNKKSCPGYRQSDECLFIYLGIFGREIGLGLAGLYVEARQSQRAANQEQERSSPTCVMQIRDLAVSPGKSQHRGSHAERNHIGNRVQLKAELRSGVRHARDAAIQKVKQRCETYY